MHIQGAQVNNVPGSDLIPLSYLAHWIVSLLVLRLQQKGIAMTHSYYCCLNGALLCQPFWHSTQKGGLEHLSPAVR